MQTQTKLKTYKLNFQYVPAFAQYLLTHKLEEYVDVLMEKTASLNIPLMSVFKHLTVTELKSITLPLAKELLTNLANNDAEKQIQESIVRWINNEIPNLDKYEIVTEDISLIALLRKKALLHFLPGYTQNIDEILHIIEEIDLFTSEYITASTETYFQLLQNKIDDHSHFINKINNTLPGAVYIFDLVQFRYVYTNEKIQEILGYNQEEFNLMGMSAFEKIVHPDDRTEVEQILVKAQKLKDGEIASYKFRVLKPNGDYIWIRNYLSVFKRNEDHSVQQVISICLDVHKEKTVADELKSREEQLLEAQEIAQLGSFTWNFDNKGSQGSPQLYQILEVDPDDFSTFLTNVHPSDKARVEAAIQQSFVLGYFDCEYRYIGKQKEKYLWTKGKVFYKNGEPVSMTGTVMDITERQLLLQQIHHSQEIYKQAEELAKIGNWSWDLRSGIITWTDQLYRIYGLEPQSETITIERFLSFIHPEDKQLVEYKAKSAESDSFTDLTFRIITKSGEVKTLRSIARQQRDEHGQVRFIIGTEQDISEREELIRNLQHSQSLYKQAEALAHIGSWSWDIKKDKVVWTDELYKIYGLDPQSVPINFSTYQSLLHPEDRDHVIATIQKSIETREPYEFIHRIALNDGSIRYLQSHGEVLIDKNNEPYKLIGTAQDVTERQNLIERLKESEKLYKQAQLMANLGNWTTDLISMEFTWSDEMYAIYEMERRDKLTIEEWYDLIHPDDREEIISYWQECLNTRQPYDKTHRIIVPSGKVKTLHRKGEFISDATGKPIKAIGITQDVTEQYRIQRELKENQTFIRKITDATPSIISSYNVNTGKYVFISEGLKKILGYDIEEAMKEGVAFFINKVHPDDLENLIKENAQTLEEANKNPDSSPVKEFTYRLMNKEGRYLWVNTYGTVFDRNNLGQVEHVLNITLDVTEHRQATEKIEEQELFIKQVADASPTILYLFDVEKSTFSYINHEIYYVLGYTPEEVIEMQDKSTLLLYHPEDVHLLPERRETEKKFQHSNSMIQYECRMRNKDNDWRWLVVREVVFKRDAAGKPVQILGAALDITRRKEMERSLLQNSFQLEQSNASLEEFAYVASHDLKEPLRKISTFGDRMLQTQQALLTEEGRIYLKKIIDASQRMQIMINDLLSISMITGDRSFQSYSLHAVLEDVKQTLEYKIENKNAIIEAPELPEINIVPSQFRQLFQNLLSNSLKFTKEDQQPVIKIQYEWLQPEQVNFQISKASKYLKLEFTDNGIGFEEEYAGKIFQIFQRLHGRSEYEGTGIGLAICKKIVEHHGGVIYATSKLGEGATFTIILPA